MEEGSLMGWVALGCVGDSAPRRPGQPLVVSGGSCALVAMTTPPWEPGRPVQRVCLSLEQLKGRAQALGEGRGRAESKPGKPGEGRGHLLQGIGR